MGGNYFFHYYCHQLEREFPRIIDEYLNYNNIKDEYWCKLLSDNDTTLSGKKSYNFIILHFDKVVLETNITYKGKRHPFLDALKHEWSFGKVNDIDNRKINYNELFCRAAHKENSFVYLYEDIFNALSALKYESGENYGSILVLCRTKDKSFDEVQSNYKISIKFKHEIELENNSYKKIRKLLEMAKKNMSLLMNEDGKIYAMGKMIDNPSCEYYEISFDGFFKWTLYKNKEKLLCYENMIPMIPDKEIGISNKNLELLKRTFDISDTSKFEKIIQKAVSQKHGTIVVFAENAMDEASRLEESGISITPIDISTG